MRRPRRRRRCSSPRSGRCCVPSIQSGRGQVTALLDDRLRDGCARREDFTGRGFGRERRREAR
jgi:hypothetical protein